MKHRPAYRQRASCWQGRALIFLVLLQVLAACGGSSQPGFFPVISTPSLVAILPGQTFENGRIVGTPDPHASGEMISVQLLAVDAGGAALDTFSGTVGLLTSDPNDAPPPLATASMGMALINITAVTAGASWAVTAVDLTGTDLATPASSDYEVVAGPPSRLAVLLPGETLRPTPLGPGTSTAADSQEVGTVFMASVIATDNFGNPAPSMSGTVTLTTSDTKDAEPAPVALSGGQANFPVTPVVATTNATLQATAPGFSSGFSRSFTVLSMPADRLLITLPTQSISVNTAGPVILGTVPDQTTGQFFLVRLYATDAYGNADTRISMNVTLRTSDPADADAAGDPYTVALTNGQGSQPIQLVTPDSSATVSVDTAGALAGSTSSAFNVSGGGADRLVILLPGQSLSPGFSGPVVNPAPAPSQAGSPFTVDILTTDAFGNIDTTAGGFSVTLSTPLDLFDVEPSPRPVINGQATGFSVTPLLADTNAMISASAPGLTGASATLEVTPGPVSQMVIVIPGQTLTPGKPSPAPEGTPSAQEAGTALNVTVRLVDSYGNAPVDPMEDRMITLLTQSIVDPADADVAPEMSVGGIASFMHIPITARTDYAYLATASGLSNAASSQVVVVATADRLAVLLPASGGGTQSTLVDDDQPGFGISGVPAIEQTGVPFAVTVIAVDPYGNFDSGGSATVTLALSDTRAAIPAAQILSGGMATFMVTNITQSLSHSITATDGTSMLSQHTSDLYRADAMAIRLLALATPQQAVQIGAGGWSITGSPTSKTAGGMLQITAVAIDTYGNIDTDETRLVQVTTPGDSADTEPPAAALVSGQRVFNLTPIRARTDYTAQASDASGSGMPLTSHTSSNIIVAAAAAAGLVITLPGQTLSVSAVGPVVAPLPAAALQAGQLASVGVTAVDVYGNRNFNVTTQVTVSSTDPAASNSVGPLVQGMQGGFQLYPYTVFTAGTISVTATDTDPMDGTIPAGTQMNVPVMGGAATRLINVFPGEILVPGSICPGFSSISDAQGAGLMFSFDVVAADAYCNIDAAATPTIHIVTSDPGDMEPMDAALVMGMNSFALTPVATGEITVTASDITGMPALAPSMRSFRSYPVYLGQTTDTGVSAGTTLQLASAPVGVALNTAGLGSSVYVADTGNHRVLGWSSVHALSTGLAADIVIGQADPTSGTCNRGNGVGNASLDRLCAPRGIAVDAQGNLWVADTMNHRVLRFNTPFTADLLADVVIGQSDFISESCNRGGSISALTLCSPEGVAIGPDGSLYVADTGNHRVLRYASPQSSNQAANLVLGQANMTSGLANRGSTTAADTLSAPVSIVIRSDGALFVADRDNHRVLGYTASLPLSSNGQAADLVFGHSLFTNGSANDGGSVGAETLSSPRGVGFHSNGDLFASDSGNNRVMRYTSSFSSGMAGAAVAAPGPVSHSAPERLFFWKGALFLGDTGNNRVVIQLP